MNIHRTSVCGDIKISDDTVYSRSKLGGNIDILHRETVGGEDIEADIFRSCGKYDFFKGGTAVENIVSERGKCLGEGDGRELMAILKCLVGYLDKAISHIQRFERVAVHEGGFADRFGIRRELYFRESAHAVKCLSIYIFDAVGQDDGCYIVAEIISVSVEKLHGVGNFFIGVFRDDKTGIPAYECRARYAYDSVGNRNTCRGLCHNNDNLRPSVKRMGGERT